ncbi:MAG: hypothetical protein KGJ23_14395 [Euryarchaeota archaeon]|nr:hypothetical protein [Euryarchaeota archaeon]MDE1837789.1 hypothetical protein [Euryarchaeota archaeon]MDE2046173.1 hypothetical protein [Thermoplasmata archaeon]
MEEEREPPEQEGRKRPDGKGHDPVGKGAAHRVLKLMPGGEEEGHPLSPTEARKARAAHERFDVLFTPTPLGLPCWTIESGSGQTYKVVVPAFPEREGAQCSCPDFLTRGLGTCKHLEATLAQAAASPPKDLAQRLKVSAYAPGWAAIERAQENALRLLESPAPPDPAVVAVALRRAGRLLISEG